MVRSILAALLVLLAAPAVAQDAPSTKWYVSADIGKGKNGVSSYAFGTQAPPRDSTSAVVRLSAGYQFIRYFALEAGYARLGSYSNNIDMDCSGSPQVQCIPDFRSDIDVQNFGLYSVGILPIGDRLSLRAAVGFSLRERKTHQVPVGAPDYTRHSQDVRVAFGIGAGFAVTKRMDVYAEWSKLDGSGDHPFPTGEQLNPGTVAVEAAIEVFSLGARLRF